MEYGTELTLLNQHCKWIEKCLEIEWRAKIASLNILLTAVVWRQDHNGFTHQDPGFLDVVANKSPEVVRIYLPPDGNCLLSGKLFSPHVTRNTQERKTVGVWITSTFTDTRGTA
jgi:phosphoketolase